MMRREGTEREPGGGREERGRQTRACTWLVIDAEVRCARRGGGGKGRLEGGRKEIPGSLPEEDSLLPLFNSILWVLYSLSCLVTL